MQDNSITDFAKKKKSQPHLELYVNLVKTSNDNLEMKISNNSNTLFSQKMEKNK